MKKQLNNLRILGVSALTLSLVMTLDSCKKEGCMDQNAVNYNHDAQKDDGSCTYDEGNQVTVNVNHMFGTDAMSTDSIYVDPQGTKYKFTRCDFYLSNFKFMDDNMNMLGMTDTMFLIKLGTTSLNMGKVDLTGHVHTMDAILGLDSLTSYTVDPTLMPAGHPLAPQVPAMYWTWASGYIYFALEGVYDSNNDQVIDGSDQTFAMHLGTYNFAVNNQFMIHQTLTANQDLNINLNLDYSQLFVGFDLANDNTTHTMDNMPLANALKTNLANFLSVN
ncbi:MAG: MbnP family protein [Crocinitomicaceae bacterium]